MKLLALHADFGAAKNIVKNLLLLNDTVYWPVNTTDNKLNVLINKIYPANWTDWFDHEYYLKTYPDVGIEMDLGDVTEIGLLPLSKELNKILKTQHYAIDVFDHKLAVKLHNTDYSKVLSIFPSTDIGLAWQVRAFTLKKTAVNMHNFTCSNLDDVNRAKEEFGINNWITANLINFYDYCSRNRNQWQQDGIPKIDLELIIFPENWNTLLDKLENYFEVTLNRMDSIALLEAWTALHWPVSETYNWEYSHIFPKNRTQKEIEILNAYSHY